MGSKKKKQQKQNKGLFVQWGVPVTVLVIVIIFLISNFTITSRDSAEETISKQLISEVEAYASAVKNEFVSIVGTAQGAGSIIQPQGAAGKDSWAKYAETMQQSVNGVDLVAITDANGEGYISSGEKINLSEAGYFNAGNSTKYQYVSDNGINGSESIVCSVPMLGESGVEGMIYMFANPTTITSILPVNNYGGGVGYAFVDTNGDVIYNVGAPSTFTGSDNLFVSLDGASVSGLTIAQIKLRAEKQNRMLFYATKGTESKTLVLAPIAVDGWQLMAVINQKYVDNVVYSEMKNARKMITNLAIAIGIFLLFLVANAIINKIKYGEESKDLADKADTDLLTELNNKMATERKIQEWMNENPNVQCLMFLFDIDNFKKINDTMGHAFGDEVLRTLGHQLRNEFRVTDIIGRLGGDEFVLFLKGIKSDDQLQREGERITTFFHQFRAGDYVKYSATASIGGVVVPRDATNFQDAYKAADVALYEAKRRGKNQLVFYSKDLANVESIRVSDDVEPIEDYRRI